MGVGRLRCCCFHPCFRCCRGCGRCCRGYCACRCCRCCWAGPDPIGEHEGLPTGYEPASPVNARGPRLGNSSPGTPSGWHCGAGSGRGRCGCVPFCSCCRGCGRCFCCCRLSRPEVSPKIRRGVRGTRTSSSGRRSSRNSGCAERPTAACNLTSKRRAPSHERISAMVPCWPFKCKDTWRQVRRTRLPYMSEEKVGCWRCWRSSRCRRWCLGGFCSSLVIIGSDFNIGW